MDTYLPFENFKDTAEALDPKDAAQSIRSAIRVMEIAHEQGDEKRNAMIARHPMVDMWGDAIPHLAQYAFALFENLRSPEVSVTTLDIIGRSLDQHMSWATSGDYRMQPPRWLGDKTFHASQRAGLMRLDPMAYGPLWPNEDMSLPLYWPHC